jgi:hypothetical protein
MRSMATDEDVVLIHWQLRNAEPITNLVLIIFGGVLPVAVIIRSPYKLSDKVRDVVVVTSENLTASGNTKRSNCFIAAFAGIGACSISQTLGALSWCEQTEPDVHCYPAYRTR